MQCLCLTGRDIANDNVRVSILETLIFLHKGLTYCHDNNTIKIQSRKALASTAASARKGTKWKKE